MFPKGASNLLSQHLNTSLYFSGLLLGSVRSSHLFSCEVWSFVSFPLFSGSYLICLCTFFFPLLFKHDFNLQVLERTKKQVFEVLRCLLLELNHLLIKEQDQCVAAGT